MARKRVAAVLAALMMIGTAAVPVGAQQIRVLVDGQPIFFDQPPVVIGGRVLVPLRGVFERLGAFVQWDPRSNTVTAFRGDTEVRLTIGARIGFVNGRTVALDVPPMIVGGRTLVPLRFVSEALGATVDWDEASRTVFITSGRVAQPPVPPPPPPPPPAVSVVEGIVFRVDAQVFPQRILVRRDTRIHTFLVTPDTAITRLDAATGRGGAISLGEIRPGDPVRVTADAAGRALAIRVSVREVSGRIDVVTPRVIVLEDGQAYTLTDEVRIVINGQVARVGQLREGMEVTIRLNPQTGEVIEVRARGQAAEPPVAVRIDLVRHSAERRPLSAGDRLVVVLEGSAGGAAAFDIFGVTDSVPMREVAAGRYEGRYLVRAGDNVTNGAVFGRLRVAGRELVRQADVGLTIDTRAPGIVDRSPAAGTAVGNARPNIVVVFTDHGGSGVDPDRSRIFVDGQDVTGPAVMTHAFITYTPPRPLSGQVRIRVVLADQAGNVTDDAWRFTVAVRQSALIRSVTVAPTTPVRAGDVVTVSMQGVPGGRAAFTIEGLVADAEMQEVQSGIYQGSLRVPSVTEAIHDARIVVTLARNGRVERAEATARLTVVAAAVPPPVILSPAPGSTVGAPIVIRGRAVPGADVVLRVDYRGRVLLLTVQGTYGEVSDRADRNGNWQVRINPSVRIEGAVLTITAITIDPLGRRSPPAVVQVIQR